MSVKPTGVKIKQVSSDTAAGPGISNGNTERRKGRPLPPQRGTGGGS